MNIVIDGSTLSMLLYTHMNGNGNQMGFLVGYKANHVQDRISDSQIHAEDTKSYIYVSSFVPLPGLKHLHKQGSCRSIKEILNRKDHQHGADEEIVGWYSLRHGSSLRPSLREASTHHQLAAFEEFEDNQDFLFLLCTSSATQNLSTHSSDIAFKSYDPRKQRFETVTTSIRNLGDTSRSEYQKPSMSFRIHSRQAQEVVDGSTDHFVKPTGEVDQVLKIKEFAESIGKSLSSMQRQVNKSEATLSPLEDEVRYLRKKMAHLETKDMQLKFNKELQRMKEEKEDSLKKENADQNDEKEQINKLLTDLGLSTDIASTIFHKPEERIRKMSQDQDNLISWEKMEVNPLYASTLGKAKTPSFKPSAPSAKLSDNSDNDSSSSDTPVVMDAEPSLEKCSVTKNNDTTLNISRVNKPLRDPFDFVEQFKSELNGPKQSSTASASSLVKSNVTTSIPPSTADLSDHKDVKRDDKEHGKSGCASNTIITSNCETDSSTNDEEVSSSLESVNSQLSANQSRAMQDSSAKLSSSPMF